MAYTPIPAITAIGQTASIGTTTIVTPSSAGLYRIYYYMRPTVAGSVGTVLLTLGWNDGLSTQSLATTAVSLTSIAAGNYVQGAVTAYLASGQALTYATTAAGIVGSPQYALRIRVVPLEQ